MKKILLGAIIAALFLPVSAAFAAENHCVGDYHHPTDEVCNNREAPCNDTEAPCGYSQDCGNGICNYTDNNNNDICDYYETGHHGERHHSRTGYGYRYRFEHGCHR